MSSLDPGPPRPRPQAVRAYIGAVAAVAVVCVAGFFLTDVGDFHRPWLVGVIALLIAFEGATAVKLAKGRGQSATEGPEEALFVFMALVFSPIAALVAVAAGALFADIFGRRGILKTTFNVVSFTGAAALALTAVDLIGGTDEIGVRRVVAVLVGALIFATATRVAVSGVLALAVGTSFWRELAEDVRPWGLLLAGNASVGLLAGLAALSYSWTVPFAFAALLALSFGFAGHARARRESQTLQDLISSSWDGIFSIDGDGVIQLWNPAMTRLSGVAPADAFGKPAAAVLDLRDELGAEAVAVVEASAADGADTAVLQLHADGGSRWLRISRSPLPDGGYSFIVRDITNERDAEESIRENEERLRLALEAGAMGWWERDLATRRAVWSESLAAMFGYGAGECGGAADFVARVHPEDRDAFLGAAELALRSGRFGMTYRVVWPDGTVRWLEGNARLVKTRAGAKMIGVTRDVTERKQMEANLLHAQKVEAVGTLAAGIAHDFNNMLSVVNGYSELTLGALDPDDPLRSNIEEIAAAGNRAAAISTQLLTFSRKDAPEPEAVDLTEVIEGIARLLPSVLPAGVEVVVATETGVGTIRGIGARLEQALMNLAVNAAHAMPHGGRLTIDVANADVDGGNPAALPAGRYVRLAVTDTGTGMDEETRRRIFEPFFTTKERREGTGLGLAMVAATVEQSGGALSVTSSPGAGTTFELFFPRLDVVSPAIGGSVHSLDPSSATVLLVDDSAGVRAFERLILEDEGYSVLEAENAADALQLAARHARIDVLVTDVVMPDGSGPELARQIAASQPELRVVYVSGFSRAEVAREGVRADDVCLLKPVTPDGLAAAIRDARRAPARSTRTSTSRGALKN